jgi:hypothetical protein
LVKIENLNILINPINPINQHTVELIDIMASVSTAPTQQRAKWSSVVATTQSTIDQRVAELEHTLQMKKAEISNRLAQEKQMKEKQSWENKLKVAELKQRISLLRIATPRPVVADNHPPINSIIRVDDTDYLYMGCYHDPRYLVVCVSGDGLSAMIVSDACPMYAVEYDAESPNYMVCRALFKHKGSHYYVPSTYSYMGTIDPTEPWVVVAQPNVLIRTLDALTCRAVCPGYLD